MMKIPSRAIRNTLILLTSVTIGAVALYGCGGEAAPTATIAAPTAAGGSSGSSGSTQANDPEALNLMQQSSRAMRQLKSAHLALQDEGGTTSSTGDGDIALPDKMRMTTTSSKGTTDRVVVGNKLYVKAPGADAYAIVPSDPLILHTLALLRNMDAYTQYAQGATIVGNEQLEGADTRHVRFIYNPEQVTASFYQSQGLPAPAPSANAVTTATGDMWFDNGSYYVRQYKSASQPDASQNMTETVTLRVSKFNEPVSPPIEQPANTQQ